MAVQHLDEIANAGGQLWVQSVWRQNWDACFHVAGADDEKYFTLQNGPKFDERFPQYATSVNVLFVESKVPRGEGRRAVLFTGVHGNIVLRSDLPDAVTWKHDEHWGARAMVFRAETFIAVDAEVTLEWIVQRCGT